MFAQGIFISLLPPPLFSFSLSLSYFINQQSTNQPSILEWCIVEYQASLVSSIQPCYIYAAISASWWVFISIVYAFVLSLILWGIVGYQPSLMSSTRIYEYTAIYRLHGECLYLSFTSSFSSFFFYEPPSRGVVGYPPSLTSSIQIYEYIAICLLHGEYLYLLLTPSFSLPFYKPSLRDIVGCQPSLMSSTQIHQYTAIYLLHGGCLYLSFTPSFSLSFYKPLLRGISPGICLHKDLLLSSREYIYCGLSTSRWILISIVYVFILYKPFSRHIAGYLPSQRSPPQLYGVYRHSDSLHGGLWKSSEFLLEGYLYLPSTPSFPFLLSYSINHPVEKKWIFSRVIFISIFYASHYFSFSLSYFTNHTWEAYSWVSALSGILYQVISLHIPLVSISESRERSEFLPREYLYLSSTPLITFSFLFLILPFTLKRISSISSIFYQVISLSYIARLYLQIMKVKRISVLRIFLYLLHLIFVSPHRFTDHRGRYIVGSLPSCILTI